MKLLTFILLAVLGAITVSAQPFPPILRNPFTTNTPVAAQNVVTGIVTAIPAANGIYYAGQVNFGVQVLTNGADMTLAINTLRSNVHRLGGGEIRYPQGKILVLGQLLNFTNAGVMPPKMNAMRDVGAGAWISGQSVTETGGTILDMPFTNGPSKWFSGALGNWEVTGFTFLSATGQNSPFIRHTFTTVNIHGNAFIGGVSGTNALQDAIVMGGLGVAGVANYADYHTNASFQGYGSKISRNYFDKIRTAVTVNHSANDIDIDGNWVGHGSGGSLATAPAGILLDTNGISEITGVRVNFNTFETTGYKRMIVNNGAVACTFLGNGFYDPTAAINPVAITFTNGGRGLVSGGFIDNALLKVAGTAGLYLSPDSGETNKIDVPFRFGVQADFMASVPFALPHVDGSYSWPLVNDNGITWRHTTIGGVNRDQFRVIDTSATETEFQFSGSATAKLKASADMRIEAVTLWLGLNGRHYINGDIQYFTPANIGYQFRAGGWLAWSDTTTASDAAAIKIGYTNGMFRWYGVSHASDLLTLGTNGNAAFTGTVSGRELISSNTTPGSANSTVFLSSTNLNGNSFSIQASIIYSNIVLLAPTNGFNGISDPVLVVTNITGTGGNHTGQLSWVSMASLGGGITGTDTRVLYFDGANNPAGDAGFTFNDATDALTVAGVVTAGTVSSDVITQDTGTGTATLGSAVLGGSSTVIFNATLITNSGVYVAIAANTTTNLNFATDVVTNTLVIGTVDVAFLISNLGPNRITQLYVVNRTNDVNVSWPATVNGYPELPSIVASNSTTLYIISTMDGKTNLTVGFSQLRYRPSTNDFVLNAYNTNNSTRMALIYATIAMTNILAGDVSRVGLYLDNDGDGSWEKTGIECRLNGVALMAGAEELSAGIMPGGRWIFTNLSAGVTPSAIIQANSSLLVRP